MAKMTMRRLLLEYDMKLVDEHATSTFNWSTALVPHPKLRMYIRKRTV